MDERLNKLLENQKKQEDIEIAQNADRLLVEGSSDSNPSVAKLENDRNIVRQIYSAIGHETLESENNYVPSDIIEDAKQSLPFHDNQSIFLNRRILK
ncbi:MAG TPA: hypothetical protein GXZ70_10190 [Clostridiales bacterium]|nr:hypothetical protein [Clostridiales bacterium]